MFTITSTRIVGLIAVVCAVIVAPQALAMPSTDSQDATPTIIAPPDPDQGYDLSGLDLSDLNNIPGYQQQQEYLKGLALAALAGGTHQERQGGDVRLHADQPRLGRGSDRGEEVRGQARIGARREDRTGGLHRPGRVRLRLLGMRMVELEAPGKPVSGGCRSRVETSRPWTCSFPRRSRAGDIDVSYALGSLWPRPQAS